MKDKESATMVSQRSRQIRSNFAKRLIKRYVKTKREMRKAVGFKQERMYNKLRTLDNIRRQFNMQMSKVEFKRLQKELKETKDTKTTIYSVTVTYRHEVKSRKNDFGLSDAVVSDTFRQPVRMTTQEAKLFLADKEDELNKRDSYTYHVLTFKAIDNLKFDQEKNTLSKMKMYKCDYSLYNSKISEWTDIGQLECVFETLMHRYDGVHGLRLSKERIYDVIFTRTYNHVTEEFAKPKEYDFKRGVTCEELNYFAEWLGVPMYCVDRTSSLFYKHIPTKRDRHYPALCFICSNNHMYLIEDKKCIYSYRNLASDKIVKSRQIADNRAHKKTYHDVIVDSEDLNQMLNKLVLEDNRLPTFSRYNGQVQRIVCGDTRYTACENMEKMKSMCATLGLDFAGQHMTRLGYDMFLKLYPKHKQSTMNNTALKLFRDNNKSGFCLHLSRAKGRRNGDYA